ncbi:MAG: CoA-binding protein [Acidimicrobiia bacterium]
MPSRTVIEEFLTQRHLAFVGASRDPKQFANAVYRHLREGGREMYPVHPIAADIEGDLVYARLADVPDPVDGVVVMVKPDAAEQVVQDAIARGVPRVWLHRGVGNGAVTERAVELCREAGVAVVDGACPMMFAEPVGAFHRLHRLISGRRIAA